MNKLIVLKEYFGYKVIGRVVKITKRGTYKVRRMCIICPTRKRTKIPRNSDNLFEEVKDLSKYQEYKRVKRIKIAV